MRTSAAAARSSRHLLHRVPGPGGDLRRRRSLDERHEDRALRGRKIGGEHLAPAHVPRMRAPSWSGSFAGRRAGASRRKVTMRFDCRRAAGSWRRGPTARSACSSSTERMMVMNVRPRCSCIACLGLPLQRRVRRRAGAEDDVAAAEHGADLIEAGLLEGTLQLGHLRSSSGRRPGETLRSAASRAPRHPAV